jgi:hypothetical protein
MHECNPNKYYYKFDRRLNERTVKLLPFGPNKYYYKFDRRLNERTVKLLPFGE